MSRRKRRAGDPAAGSGAEPAATSGDMRGGRAGSGAGRAGSGAGRAESRAGTGADSRSWARRSGADLAVLVAVFAVAAGVAELAGAANLGVALGVGQVAFVVALVVLLLRD